MLASALYLFGGFLVWQARPVRTPSKSAIKANAESYLANMFSIGCGFCTHAVPLSRGGAAALLAMCRAAMGRAVASRAVTAVTDIALHETQIKMGQVLSRLTHLEFWLRGQDLNLRPSGYEPDELPDCSTPRLENKILTQLFLQCK